MKLMEKEITPIVKKVRYGIELTNNEYVVPY
jgi:hypothetical protein